MAQSKLKSGIGYVAPRLLLVFFAVDVALRIAQVFWGVFEIEALIPRSKIQGEPYRRNVRVHVPGRYGDLVAVANIRDRSEPREMRFSTDGMGFRNTGEHGPVAGIMFGDSFAVMADDDQETLPAQLGRRIGCTVYNAASPDYEFRRPDLELVESIATRVGVDEGFVIIELVERLAFESRSKRLRLEARDSWWGDFRARIRALQRAEPINRYLEDLMRGLQSDRILPNGYAQNVVRSKLVNGDSMFFYPAELVSFRAKGVPSVDYWVALDRQLKRKRFELKVVLVPNKYTVYYPHIEGRKTAPEGHGELLSRFEKALRSAGVSVVNVAPVLRAQAAAGIARHEYVYWRNDSHWNLTGVKLAAAEIDRAFPELRKICKKR